MAYGATSSDGAPGWQPSVKYLLILVIAEIFVMGLIRGFTKHGG